MIYTNALLKLKFKRPPSETITAQLFIILDISHYCKHTIQLVNRSSTLKKSAVVK